MSWDELSKTTLSRPSFLIEPYIVREGITLLWAGTSLGKSPLTWAMASAIGNGTDFFGLPTQKARVLYVELDTPPPAIIPRIQKLPPAEGVWWYFSKPLSIPFVSGDQKETFTRLREEIKPDVVFLNTLRKLHDLDDKDSKTPKLVYSFFQGLFPESALVFIHHTRKSPIDPKFQENDKESFSGSNHFLDDAQVGLHLQKFDGEKENLRLWHRKSQVSELLKPLPLRLEKDGSTLSSPLADELLYAHTLLEGGKRPADVIREYATFYGCSEATSRRRVNVVMNGLFPGTGFLSPSFGGED